jgi:hypothetical protein
VNGRDLDSAAPQVSIISYEKQAAQVRLRDCRFGKYETTFAVGLHSDGLEARIGEVSVNSWDNGGLTRFMDGLATDFRGWAGTRSWAVNHLKITAVFHSGGHVELCWAIRAWITRSDWEASLTTWIEGGQQMTGLAAAIKTFLTQTQPVQLWGLVTHSASVPGAGDPLAVLGDGFQYLVGVLGPGERLGVLVPLADPPADVGFQTGDAAVG